MRALKTEKKNRQNIQKIKSNRAFFEFTTITHIFWKQEKKLVKILWEFFEAKDSYIKKTDASQSLTTIKMR